MRAALLTFPSLNIVNLPVEIVLSRQKGEDTIHEVKVPKGHPNEYSMPWNAWGEQYVREITLNDTLRQLFLNGPTFDGDMASKSERSDMVGLGLVARYDGYQTLTQTGLEICMRLGMDRVKESRGR